MYKISKWKLILIILVFIFTGLYLLPSIPSLYGSIYGYFDLWMQKRIPKPEVQSDKDGDYINIIVASSNLPKGMNFQEASKEIADTLSRRLEKIGYNRNEFQFLILDEPAQHLDIETKEVVEKCIDEFKGAVLLISHDIYSVSKVAIDKVFRMDNNTFSVE